MQLATVGFSRPSALICAVFLKPPPLIRLVQVVIVEKTWGGVNEQRAESVAEGSRSLCKSHYSCRTIRGRQYPSCDTPARSLSAVLKDSATRFVHPT